MSLPDIPPLHLSDIRSCFEGAIPAIMATCARDGTPNVAYLSQVHHVDEQHVGLSFQFFNKTRQNILEHPFASVLLLDPHTSAFYRLHIRYLRTETAGPLFERMKAQLAGIASYSGMDAVFVLRGADVYAVERIERVPGTTLPPPAPHTGRLGALRCCAERLAHADSLDALLDAALDTLDQNLGMRHAMVLMLDAASQRLYTVASRGYAHSGVGSEVELGDGIIGVAARECTPVRVGHMTSAYLYSRAVHRSVQAEAPGWAPEAQQIPYPGLAEPHSQMAVPIRSAGRLLGVLFVESPQDLAHSYEDEDALVVIAGQLGAAIALLRDDSSSSSGGDEPAETPAAAAPAKPGATPPLQVRRYPVNDSVFLNDQYLIKGVAGAIFWKLLRDHARLGRTEFSNRELRLDTSLRLPDVTDNLEARLLLLQRRLAEQSPGVRIEKTGRGRFRLLVQQPLELLEMPAAG